MTHMTTKPMPTLGEQLDGLKFISQTHRGLFQERVKHSHQQVALVATLYLLSVAGRFGTSVSPAAERLLSSTIGIALVWALFLLLALLSTRALWLSLNADKCNQIIAQNAEDEIIAIVSSKGKILPNVNGPVNANRHALLWRASLIWLLAVVSALLLTCKP